MTKQFDIHIVTWASHQPQLRAVRTPVFIDEQLVAPAFEWDDIDVAAVHLLASHNSQPIGCLRIIDYYKIGRMAVLQHWRKQGVGLAMLQQAINICQTHGSKKVCLSAQTHAIGFYIKAGFVVISDIYQDVHIAHVDMQRDL